MIKAIIFDLDGTLLYTLEDLKDSVNFALEQFNYPLKTVDEVRNFVGNGVKLLVERSIPNGAKNPNLEQVLKVFKTHYAENMYNKTKPFDGINEMLDKLKQKGIRLAVVSNKFDFAVKELCQRYFGKKIEIAVGESESVRKKPAPDSVLKVMEILNCNNDETFYVGDSEVDIQTAVNCNLKCISVTWGYKSRKFLIENDAKIIVDTPKDLLNFVLNDRS